MRLPIIVISIRYNISEKTILRSCLPIYLSYIHNVIYSPQNPPGQQVTFDARYVGSLLLDKSNIANRDYATGLDLLRNYSKIPEEEIPSHVADIVRNIIFLLPHFPFITQVS